MPATLTMRLGELAAAALEEHAERAGARPDALIRTALRYYLSEREAGRPSWPVPPFELPDGPPLTVELDDQSWRGLTAEARAQGVPPERLAEHATLFFFADLDSGRVAERLEDLLD